MIPGSETTDLSTHSTESNMILSIFAIVPLASSLTVDAGVLRWMSVHAMDCVIGEKLLI